MHETAQNDSTPQSLNCPNCGAAVSSDKTQCEFCRSRLKSVGCPACLGLMFAGSKFCTHCGTRAAAVSAVEEEKPSDCPRCRRPLEVIEIDRMRTRECTRCGGFWLETAVFEELCASGEQQAAVLSFIGIHPHEVKAAPINYVPCPECKQLMNRSNFARSSGVIIDLCKQHGVWFDVDELPKIFEFINKGGMARAREKEKIAIQEERNRLRDEQRRMAVVERRTGNVPFDREEKEPGIGGFIAALFDI